MKTMETANLQYLEKIDIRPSEPWKNLGLQEIRIAQDAESASQDAITLLDSSDIIVYSEAAINRSNWGAAAAIIDRQNRIKHKI